MTSGDCSKFSRPVSEWYTEVGGIIFTGSDSVYALPLMRFVDYNRCLYSVRSIFDDAFG